MAAGITTFSKEVINYLRVCYVTTHTIPDGLRIVFKREWDNRYKAMYGRWLDTTNNGIDFYNMESPRSQSRNSREFNKIKNGNTLEWDCTCLFVSILYSDSIGATLDPTVKKSIDNLRQFRNNNFAHVPKGSLSEDDFQTCIKTVVSAFTTLKLDVDVLQKIKKQEKFPKELKQQLEEEKKRDEEPQPFCTLPPKPSHEVINRTGEIMKILEEMKRLRRDKKNEITIIYLSGNPGCGKSEMARQIGDKISKADIETDRKFVFTLNASSIDTLIQSYIEFSYTLRCDENSTTIGTLKDLSKDEKLIHLKVLITTKLQKYSSWLLIVDNVTDIKSISRYIPKAGEKTEGKGQLLVTTQDSQSIANDPYTYHRSLKDGMQYDEAIQALCKISDFAANKEITIQVAKALDFQPLALACAATYMRCIRSTDLSISWEKYMEKLEEGKQESTETEYETISLAYSQPMTAAVRMAVEREMNKKSVMMHALQFLSVMAPEPIQLEYVAKYVKTCMPDEDQFRVASNISRSSLIITEDESKEIHVHQIVHQVAKSFLEKKIIDNNKEHTFTFLVKVIETFGALQQSYKNNDFNSTVATRSLVVHFMNLAENLSSCILNTVSLPKKHLQQLFKTDSCLLLMGRICKENGKYVSSLIFLKIILMIKEKCDGQNQHALADILNNIGIVLGNLGKYEEAKKYLERALAIDEITYDQNHPVLATRFNNLGVLHIRLGKYEKAKRYFERALSIQEMTCGQKHPELATTLSNLGSVLSELGRYEEAKKCLERALAINEMTYDQNNPNLATTLSNLGNVLRDLGRYEEAEKCLKRALAIDEMTYDQNHPYLAITLINVGNVLRELGKYKEAEKCLKKALAIDEMTYDQNHPYFAFTYNYLGKVFGEDGKNEEAINCLKKALEIRESVYNQNHPHLAATLSNLGKVLSEIGQQEEAKKYLERALAIQEMAYDQSHPILAITLNNQGRVLSDTGKQEEAKKCFERALTIQEMAYDQNHPALANTLRNLGKVLRHFEKEKEAKKCFERAVAIEKKVA